jgi:WD40-like Beta Propeller Repeat
MMALFLPRCILRRLRENKMVKTYHWGPLATAAGGTLVAVGLVVLIMLVVVEARPAEATFPGKPGKIAYEGKDGANGDFEIYTINPGGGSKLKLTDNTTIDSEPSYSPSGKKIVYSGRDAPNGDLEIYTITPVEEVRSKLPTTIRKTIRLPGGAVSREAPPSSCRTDQEKEWRSSVK